MEKGILEKVAAGSLLLVFWATGSAMALTVPYSDKARVAPQASVGLEKANANVSENVPPSIPTIPVESPLSK